MTQQSAHTLQGAHDTSMSNEPLMHSVLASFDKGPAGRHGGCWLKLVLVQEPSEAREIDDDSMDEIKQEQSPRHGRSCYALFQAIFMPLSDEAAAKQALLAGC